MITDAKRKDFLYMPKGKANETHAFIAGRTNGLYAINHATGCSHGCRYPCFARLIRKMTYEQWNKPVLHSSVIKSVERELTKFRGVKDVELCFMTDPFMEKQPEMWETSNALIEILHDKGIGVTVLTKGDLTHAVDLDHVKYGISIVSLDENFRRKWEPGTAKYMTRIAGLKDKHDKGYPTWISVEPFPAAQDGCRVLDVMDACHFADKAILGQWNYNSAVPGGDGYKATVADFLWFCETHGMDGMVKVELQTAIKL